MQTPDYYKTKSGIECRQIIKELGLNYNLGCVLKYLWRAGKKSDNTAKSDLQKAINYLKFEIYDIEERESEK